MDAFAAAMAAHGLRIVAGKAAEPWNVSINAYDSQSKVNAIVSFLRKKRARQHIKCVLVWGTKAAAVIFTGPANRGTWRPPVYSAPQRQHFSTCCLPRGSAGSTAQRSGCLAR